MTPGYSDHSQHNMSQYWTSKGMPWRTLPEISDLRKQELRNRLAIQANPLLGIYPFKRFRLNRDDVEWLLAVHEGGLGPVNWNDPAQRGRNGLDLRGADLRSVDLRRLPLARTIGGLSSDEYFDPDPRQLEEAAAHFEDADFGGLYDWRTRLEGCNFTGVHLERANLTRAHLERANLDKAHLEGADLTRAHMEWATVQGAHLEGALLHRAHLEGVNLTRASLGGREYTPEALKNWTIWLHNPPTILGGADLTEAFFDHGTDLAEVDLGGSGSKHPRFADIRWNGVNVAVIPWKRVTMLGDEWVALQKRHENGKKKSRDTRIAEFETAVRATRQVGAVLRDQGINEGADLFALHGQNLERRVFRMQGDASKYLVSWILNITAGYGYRPRNGLILYTLTNLIFAAIYFFNGLHGQQSLTFLEAIELSIYSFHGRGFFITNIALGQTDAFFAMFQAFLGLIIEATFIATLIQRYFNR